MSRTKTEDLDDLARFGYKPVLDRTLGGFSSFAAGFSYISVLTGVFQMFYVGYRAGGPAFYWTWPMVFLGQFAVALCFAELASRYPLSGGIYQWSRRVGSRVIGWMAGWVYLFGSVITLAAVALALQATLPQVAPWFQWIGDRDNPADSAWNAVVLGTVLIAATTVINSVGVRILSWINNVGVVSELIGVVLLTLLLALRMRRGPAVLLESNGHGSVGSIAYLGPFLAASLMASYVLYGFDTAGALAEETDEPRRRAPWAILQALGAAALAGGLLMLFGILAVSDPLRPELGQISGGLPFLVKDVLGPTLGTALLIEVVFAVFVCALAVHAGSVRLMFAMARDNNLPFAHALAHVPHQRKAPVVPAVAIGVMSAAILVVNINRPRLIETLCSVAIIWVNLAYLLVTLPLLAARIGRGARPVRSSGGDALGPGPGPGSATRGLFSLGRFGLAINVLAVAWGVFVIVNIGWPRAEVYGSDRWGRFAAPLATLALFATGAVYFLIFKRNAIGILAEHRAEPSSLPPVLDTDNLPLEPYLVGHGRSV